MIVNAPCCAVMRRQFSTLRVVVLLLVLSAIAALPARADDYLFGFSDSNGVSVPVYLTVTLSTGGTIYLSTATTANGPLNQGWWTQGCCVSAPFGSPNNNYQVGTVGGVEQRDYFGFSSLPTLGAGVTITGATLNLLPFTGSVGAGVGTNATVGLVISGVNIAPADLSTVNGTDPVLNAANFPAYFVALGAGQTNTALNYGSFTAATTTTDSLFTNTGCIAWADPSDPLGTSCAVSFGLNTNAVAALNTAITSGIGYFTVGGSVVTNVTPPPPPPPPPPPVVPEPASIVMVASGLAALAGRRLRRN